MKCESASKTRSSGAIVSLDEHGDDGAGAAGAATGSPSGPRGCPRPRRSCPPTMRRSGSIAGTQVTSPSRTTNAPTRGVRCSPEAAAVALRWPSGPTVPVPPPPPPPDRRGRDHEHAVALDRLAEHALHRDAVVGLLDSSGGPRLRLRGSSRSLMLGSRASRRLPLAWYWSDHSFGGGSAGRGAGAEHPGDLGGEVGGGPAAVVAWTRCGRPRTCARARRCRPSPGTSGR